MKPRFWACGVMLVSLLSLAGCQTTSETFTGPTGEKVSTVRCTTDPTSCYKKATESCGGGTYRVVGSYRNAGGIFADVLPGPVTWYTMSLVCGKPDGVLPQFPLRGAEPAMPKMPEPQTPVVIQPSSPPRTTTCMQANGMISCHSM